jgi:hypothetical protein
MIRACGSPKHPRTLALGRKPGETYASASRRGLRVLSIGKSCQIFSALSARTKPYENRLGSVTTWPFLPTLKPEDPNFLTGLSDGRLLLYSRIVGI